MALAALVALALHLVWALWLSPDGRDLAAQTFWTRFAADRPGHAYTFSWYGGAHPASYSLLSPHLLAWGGVRPVAVACGTLSAALLALLLVRLRAPAALAASLWGAVALSGNVFSFRVTFGIGLTAALAALYAAVAVRGRRARVALVALLGVTASLASPVAGLFLLVAGVALLITGDTGGRSPGRGTGAALVVGLPLVAGMTSLLFPAEGVQPISLRSVVLPAAACTAAVLVAAPRSWVAVRVGALVYLLGIGLTYAVPSPVGSNVERLALLFGGALLLSAVAAARRTWQVAVLGAALLVSGGWSVVKPLEDQIDARPALASARGAAALRAALDRHGARLSRVEVVPLRSHWEASGLARDYALARGWNRQLDTDRHALFYDGRLTAASYRDWLRRWAVGFVVLPAQPLDKAGRAEAALIARGLPYLTEIHRDARWHLYRVRDAVPIASAPARVTAQDTAALTVTVPSPGTTTLRVAWSPWLAASGDACLTRDGAFATLRTTKPGHYRITAPLTWPRGTPCP